MEFNSKKVCPKCNLLFDKLIHIPLKLPKCNHSICSKCICEILIKNINEIICPIDKIVNKQIKSINNLEINHNLIDQIGKREFNENNSKILITEIEENEINSKKEIFKTDSKYLNRNDYNLNTSFSSTFLNLKNKNENNSVCSLHLLPNNIICVNDRIKICSECAKNKLHNNHEILTEDELLEQIEKLIDKYQEIEKKTWNINEKIYEENINKTIDEKIEKIKEILNITKNEIINNINIQIEQIIYYLDFRKNELKNKCNFKCFEIKQLKEVIIDWKKITYNKLNKLNEINNSSDCFKLLDKDPNKSLNSLFQKGVSLNDKYNKLNENIDNLIKFCDKGINITSNNDLIEKIKFTYTKKKNNKNSYIINTKLFNIIENEELMDGLNLIKFHFENENRHSLNKSFGNNKNKNELKISLEKNKEKKENLNPIITFKQNYNNNIYNNFNSYNYNYQNNVSPKVNKNIKFDINFISKSPNNNTSKSTINKTIKEHAFKKIDNKKVHYYKINPNKINNIRDDKNHMKKFTYESLNKFNELPSTERNKNKLKIKKKESISNKKKNLPLTKNSIHISNNNKNITEFDNSKLSKIINPIENVSYQDSFNNLSNLNYLSSIFEKNTNNNINDLSNLKGKLDTENSFLNFSKLNSDSNKNNLKKKKENVELNNLIINQLKKDSPNFNGKNMSGNGMIQFCNMMQKMEKIKFNELLMEHCHLNDEDVNLLLKILIEKSANLEMLDLSWNQITDQSALYILELIKENKSLNILLLNNNTFSLSLKNKLESYVNLGREGLGNIKLCI